MALAHSLDRPAATALIVVDLQTAFVEPSDPLATPGAHAMLRHVQAVADQLRGRGGTIAWTRHGWSDDPAVANAAWFRSAIGAEAETRMRRLVPGSAAHAIHPGLRVDDRDIVIDKYRPSAFLPDHAGLHPQLRARGIDTVVDCGTVTSFCCQSTARDALMLDYRVCFPPDLNAGQSDAAQRATLADLRSMGLFDLRPSAALCAEIDA